VVAALSGSADKATPLRRICRCVFVFIFILLVWLFFLCG
jgi:hypothetical protein